MPLSGVRRYCGIVGPSRRVVEVTVSKSRTSAQGETDSQELDRSLMYSAFQINLHLTQYDDTCTSDRCS